jgi:hypothetical protein
MQVPRPRAQVQYQKPNRINAVSLTLTFVLGVAAWVGVSFWPVLILRSNVKNELAEVMPVLWKLNLRPEPQARADLIRLKRDVTARIRAVGVADDKLELTVGRSKEWISLSATFRTTAQLRGLKRVFTFTLSPKAETDAARVDW